MLHIIKTIDPWFEQQWAGVKTFEFRVKDRNYMIGDYLLSRHYDPKKDWYSGRQILLYVPQLIDKFIVESFVGNPIPTRNFVIMSTELIWKTIVCDSDAAVEFASEIINEREAVLLK